MSQKFYEIIAKVMDVSESQITDESSAETIENWDSFNLYVLLDEIESAFNVKFTLEETLEFKTHPKSGQRTTKKTQSLISCYTMNLMDFKF